MRSLVLFASLVIVIFSCKRSDHIAGVPVTRFFAECDPVARFGEIIKTGDPNGKFRMAFPYEWDIREMYSDTLYGIVAISTPFGDDDTTSYLSVSVFGYRSELSLAEYTKAELESLKGDRNIRPLETGLDTINGLPAAWILFEDTGSEPPLLSIVVYFRNDASEEIFLVQCSTLQGEGAKEQLCSLKILVNTFEFSEPVPEMP